VQLTSDGSTDILRLGSWNTIDGIEFRMTSEHPAGSGIAIRQKQNIIIRNCRFWACQVGVRAESVRHLRIASCEMAFSGAYGIHLVGTGQDAAGHLEPADASGFVVVRNCYLHDAGWNVNGTEGYGFTANGAVENLVIENCQIDNNSGNGILYEDWAVHTTARYNVIRGSGIAGIWIDNSSMCIFDNNYLEANNVAVWLSGEESSNRYRTDLVSIRNNIIVHNDWAFFDPSGADRSVYGKSPLLITSSTRDVYFDNNTVAFNKGKRLVGIENRPPQNEFSNIWFRNNIFWKNEGTVAAARDLGVGQFHFTHNLWDTPYEGDAHASTGDPLFVDPTAHGPEGYRLQSGSAARGKGLLLYENQVDFWNGRRPHLSKTERYDIGAHQFGSTGSARIGLDLATFPFEVPPFQPRFKARPMR
jgi:parallel beta-helix repeat protein